MTGARWPMIALAAFAAPALATPAPEIDAFERMKRLQGRWVGTSSAGRRLEISYRLIAGDSVLVETWRSPSGRETMTVYHRDGDRLVATHYCAQGNQPSLLLEGADKKRLSFAFRDAAGLEAPDEAHLVSFWIEPEAGGGMRRSETYREGSEGETETAVLKRIE